MRVLVMGAGVIGVTTAYQLLKDGHEVIVVDRDSEPASFTSYANAGLVAPGHAYAWASPRAPAMMFKSLWRNDQAIRFRPSLDPRLWAWTWQFLGQCNAKSAERNTLNKLRLCRYSQQQFDALNDELSLEYDGRGGGLIYFYRSAQSLEAAAAKCEILRRQGLEIETLDRDALIAADPGLAPAADIIAGGLMAKTDASGDTRLFTIALAKACADMGAEFRMGHEVEEIECNGKRVTRIVTDHGQLVADAYVLSLGVFSPQFAKALGIKLPIYPIKGYSVTLPVSDNHDPPRLGGVDEDNLLAYCPLGDRLRLTATAEFAGYSNDHRPSDFDNMLAKAKELLPHAADFSRPDYWAGLRPMTPTGLPIIDRSPIDNLWLNTGHGHMGWTMSCGSARILADLIAQRKPAIARDGMHYGN